MREKSKLIEIILILLALLSSFLVKFNSIEKELILIASAFIVVYLLKILFVKESQPHSAFNCATQSLITSLILTVVFASIAYFDWTFRISRVVLLTNFALIIIFLFIYKYTLYRLNKINTAIIIFTDKPKNSDKNKIFLNNIENLKKCLKDKFISKIIINLPKNKYQTIYQIINICYQKNIKVFLHFSLLDLFPINKPSTNPYIELTFGNPNYRILKRIIDFSLSLICLILAFLLLTIISILIKLDSKGPILYSQTRLGRFNKPFTIYKFRTMVKNAEKKTGPRLLKNNKDSYITKLGYFLRSSHLDELPQLFNILKGEMSFVGPRPERPEFSNKFSKSIRNWNHRLFIKPGISGLAQLKNISSLEPEKKIEQDIIYLKNMSLSLDLELIYLTIIKVITKTLSAVTKQ